MVFDTLENAMTYRTACAKILKVAPTLFAIKDDEIVESVGIVTIGDKKNKSALSFGQLPIKEIPKYQILKRITTILEEYLENLTRIDKVKASRKDELGQIEEKCTKLDRDIKEDLKKLSHLQKEMEDLDTDLQSPTKRVKVNDKNTTAQEDQVETKKKPKRKKIFLNSQGNTEDKAESNPKKKGKKK